MRCPILVTTPASTPVAWETRAASACATWGGVTDPGRTSTAWQIARMCSSPIEPDSIALARAGSSGGIGAPVNERRGRMRAARRQRRVISRGVMRSRVHNALRAAAMLPSLSGGSASSPKIRYINPRLTRSWFSSRSAMSMRKALPTRSVDVVRNTAWAASMASSAARICSRAAGAPTTVAIPPTLKTTPDKHAGRQPRKGRGCGSTRNCG